MHCVGLVVALVMVAVVPLTEAVPCCGRPQYDSGSVAGSLAVAGSFAGSHSHGRPAWGYGCSIHHGGCHSVRRRRSLEDFLKDTKIQEIYTQIAAEDKDQCGLRLVCELAQKDLQDLAEDESQILNPYSGAGKSDGTHYGNYDEAVWYGKEGHSCATHYQRCAYTSDQVMDAYRKYSKDNPTDNDK
ncbi:uncharacterized protein [Panulirus ornatus]|uniref:uncharacterized protein n=1 Tax=Panulirus ornatus TaxID=150431 RepID=UPI003A846CDA